MNTLLEPYRHKTWATLRLIVHYQGLDDEHLDTIDPWHVWHNPFHDLALG